MSNRLELQTLLEGILGSENVYFQAPTSTAMKYPCIIYSLSNVAIKFADNRPYSSLDRYSITVIDKNADSKIREKISELPYCSFDRFYRSDNLNHFAFNLYF